jgi:intraflagellar transport protein 80
MAITWTRDGTQLAGAGGSGTVLFAQVMERSVEWRDMEARVVAPRKIRVQDVPNETFEELDFPRDRVVELALGYNHLIVATVTQCFVYTVGNLNTPIIFDLRNPVTMILLCEHHFLILDPIQGAQVRICAT